MRLLSGALLTEREVAPDMTIAELKKEMQRWNPCKDEAMRRLTVVDLVFGSRYLDDKERVDEIGLLPGAEVQVIFGHVEPVTCAHKDEAGCDASSLTFVRIPPGVRSIRPGAFQNCSSLVRVIIPDSVTSIGNDAFRHCHSLISVVIPPSVIRIAHAVFNNCHSLKSLIIPETVRTIGPGAFKGCTSLTLTISASLFSSLSGFNDCRINTKECRCRECNLEWFEHGWVCPATWRRWQRGEYHQYVTMISTIYF